VADLARHVAHVGDALVVELRPVVEYVDDVGAGARLNARGDPRLHVVTIDGLEVDLQAESLLGLRQQLLAQEGIRSRYKIVDAQPMKRGALGESRRPRCSQDAGHAPQLCGERAASEAREPFAAMDAHAGNLPGCGYALVEAAHLSLRRSP